MTISSQKADSFISTVLGISGRVRAVDLGVIPEAERGAALRDYFERHSDETPLYMTGDGELMAGFPPAEGALAARPSDAPLEASDTGIDPVELDLLLGDYDAETSVEVEPAARVENDEADSLGPLAQAGDANPAPPRGLPSSPKPSTVEDGSRIWMLWWVPTLLVPLLGGVAAWTALRDKRLHAAQFMFAVGLIAGMIASVLFLRFAEPIAGFVTGATRDTVITLPSTTATSTPGGVESSGSPSGTNGM
jgi:hypothetical protein